MKTLPMTLALLAFASPVAAGETPWEVVAPGVEMRMISSDTLSAQGTTWIGLEISMPQATKTYWRVPGESGIPPRFDFSGSRGIADHNIAWPMPKRELSDGYLDHAYYGHVVLPFELEIESDTPRLDAEILLGICADVCIPVTVNFTHDLSFSAPDRAQSLRITQALAEVPLPVADDTDLGDAVFDLEAKTLTVALNNAQLPVDDIIADIAGEMLLFGPPERLETEKALVFPLYGRASRPTDQTPRVHFTFPTPEGPGEIVRDLAIR